MNSAPCGTTHTWGRRDNMLYWKAAINCLLRLTTVLTLQFFLSDRTREQTSKCFFPFSEIFSSQVLTRFIHSPSHVVRVLQLDLWHSLLRRFEYEVRARICLQRSFSVLHDNLTKEMRLFWLCRRVEPRSRITAGNDSLVDYNSWQRSSAQKWTRRWKITRVSFLHRLCVKTNRHRTQVSGQSFPK